MAVFGGEVPYNRSVDTDTLRKGAGHLHVRPHRAAPGEHQMLFAVLFTDKPGHGALRAQNLEAHIRWVAENREAVLVAGSLRTEPGAVPKGGLWIVEAQSKAAVLELMKSDPFYTCGLRQDVEVLHWSKALEDKVLV